MNLKLATSNEPPIRDETRQALASAIEASRAAREEVKKREAALDRGRALVVAAEDELMEIAAAADKATISEGRRLAAAAMVGKKPTSAGALRAIRARQLDAEDRIAASKAGISYLQSNLADADREKLERDNAVLVEISRLLGPTAEQLLAAGKRAKAELIAVHQALRVVVMEDFSSPPHFSETTAELKARQQRAAPIDAELRREIARFIDLARLDAEPCDRDLAISVQQTWRSFREALRHAPETPIPETPIPASR